MQSARAALDEVIASYLAGRASFHNFHKLYSKLLIDDQGDVGFTPEEVDHYGVVHEKAELTATEPPLEDRQYGWISEDEFREWLAVHERAKPPLPNEE